MTTQEQPKRTLLTVKDVTERLQLSKPLVYALIESGELRAIRVGRVWRVPEASIDDFVARRLGDSPDAA